MNPQLYEPDPPRVKLMLCPDCGIHTNHARMSDGRYVCWCARVQPVDLGTRVIVSGGEVTELDKQSNNDMEL